MNSVLATTSAGRIIATVNTPRGPIAHASHPLRYPTLMPPTRRAMRPRV
jgi:hypothetical protein